MNKSKQQLGRFALTGVVIAALTLGTADCWALGLGRLSVQSSLGETLRAEIDVTSLTPEEAANLKIRIAPPDSYRAAGVDYNSVLPTTQAALLRRADGLPFLRLTSDRVVQEPFVDVILELSWSTGRLVREYTLLFDPPSERPLAAAPASAPAALTAPVFSTPVPAQPAVPAALPAPREMVQAPKPAAPERAPGKRAEPVLAAAPSAEPAASSYRVRSGDTLTGIASDKRSGSVSLDQMLVALYRGNPQAFVGDNINRLKSGVVLAVPSADTAAAVDGSEARRLIVAQSADFSSFRQKLASAVPVAQADSLARKDVGKVQARVDDGKAAAALTPDKLTLSKAASAPASAAPEARISKDKEKQDAAIRMAELSKNVEDLKKLSGATGVSKDVAASAAAPAQTKPAVPSVPALMPLPDTAASAADSASQAAAAETPASSASLAEAVAVVVPAAPPKAAAASQPASAVAAVADQEPGVLDELLENNLTSLIAGGVALLALLGFGVYRARRPKTDSGETSFLESRLQPDSFFGASGGQRINTREAASGASSSMNYSLSQLDAIGDVDPVAEADVYLAYGRDLQAEEILKEAMRSTPQRMAIRTKLLEVYAKRRDTKGFELLATQLFTLTNGEGEDWATAQAMGLEIDPENPLYQAGGRPALVDSSGLSFEPLGASTMPQAITPTPSTFADSAGSSGDELMPLDAPEPSDAVDFHLDLDEAEPEPSAGRSSQLSMEPLEFDAQPPVSAPESVASEPFEVAEVESASATPSAAMPLEFDLSDISLDLDEPANPTAQPIEEAPDVQIDEAIEDVDSDPLERKLELAEEFRLIGDVEGARDLLQEIATNAEGAMKAKALAMLEDLG